MNNAHGIRFDQTMFWIKHRRTEYGPFDYEWSNDLAGLEMHYRGEKFGEVCNEREIYADLKDAQLPMQVVRVATLTFGCLFYGIIHGLDAEQRELMLVAELSKHNCTDFLPPV